MDEQNQNMENQMDNQAQTPMDNTPHTHPSEKNKHGALIGSIIIIIILVIGGIYLFANQKIEAPSESMEETYMEDSMMMEEEVPGSDVELSDSDELDALEADLEAVGDMELDAGLE